ncbi:MAG: RNA polymerase sigma factor [Lachnospiraceae bacterium]|nr:RNA polymerase sigma factor [Lachnospiraceae bacterium]
MSLDVEEQYDRIYRYCYFKLHNRHTAEDITQETFLRYFQRYDHVTGGEALKCLYTIARNLCIDEYRRRSGERKFEYACGGFIRSDLRKENCIQENYMSGGSQEDQIIISLAVRAALSELQEDEQELLLLRYVNEVPVSAIGRMLGISRFAVHRRLAAVQKKFKDILEKKGGI